MAPESAQEMFQTLKAVARVLPAEFREDFGITIASMEEQIRPGDPLFGLLKGMGYITLLTSNYITELAAQRELLQKDVGKLHSEIDVLRQHLGDVSGAVSAALGSEEAMAAVGQSMERAFREKALPAVVRTQIEQASKIASDQTMSTLMPIVNGTLRQAREDCEATSKKVRRDLETATGQRFSGLWTYWMVGAGLLAGLFLFLLGWLLHR